MPAPSRLTVREAAESSRAIRSFAPEEVPEEDVREIIRQVRLAPSPNNMQPWRFVVVRDPGLRAQMLPLAEHQRQVGSARVLIVLYADSEDTIAGVDEFIHPGFDEAKRARVKARFLQNYASRRLSARQEFAHGIAHIALGYLLLAAEAMGYQTSPMLGFDAKAVSRLLKLPRTATIPALVALGVGAEPGLPHHRHSVERITRFI